MTPTYPDFEITVIHGPDGVEYVRATIEGRLCNVHYREAKYIAGETKPRYPVPAIRGWVEILPLAVFYYELIGSKDELIVYLAEQWPNENGITG